MVDTLASGAGGSNAVRVRVSPCAPYAFLAQLVEQWTFNPEVEGSSPSERTKKRPSLDLRNSRFCNLLWLDDSLF